MASSSLLTSIIPPAPKPPTPIARLLKPTTPAIPLLSGSFAHVYAHLHAPLLLALYAFRFNALVARPVNTMMWDLGPLALAQSAFCVVCIPPAGTWASGGSAIISGTASSSKSTKAGSGSSGGGGGVGSGAGGSLRRKPPGFGSKAGGGGGGGGGSGGGTMLNPSSISLGRKIMPTILAFLLTVLVPPLPLTILAFTLGAPLYPPTLLPHTLLLSLHVSLLAFLPLFYAHGVSSPAWRDIIAAWLPLDEAGVWGGTLGALVGGWMGAVPIALDWDRDWQAWPVTVLVGSVVGWGLGNSLMGKVVLTGKRIDMSEGQSLNTSPLGAPPPPRPPPQVVGSGPGENTARKKTT